MITSVRIKILRFLSHLILFLIVISPTFARAGWDYSSEVFFLIFFLPGIWQSSRTASGRNCIFLLLTASFFFCQFQASYGYFFWGGNAWWSDGGYDIGRIFCAAASGLALMIALIDVSHFREIFAFTQERGWLYAWTISGCVASVLFFSGKASGFVFLLYLLPCSLLGEREFHIPEILIIPAAAFQMFLLWSISTCVDDSFIHSKINELLWGKWNVFVRESFCAKIVFVVLPYVTISFVHMREVFLKTIPILAKRI